MLPEGFVRVGDVAWSTDCDRGLCGQCPDPSICAHGCHHTPGVATEVCIITPAAGLVSVQDWTDETTEVARALGGSVVVYNSEPARVLEDFTADGPRTLQVRITRRDTSGYDESGEWMDGNFRVIADHPDDVDTYDQTFADDSEPSPVRWAIELISKTDAYQPSVEPIPDELRGHEWLAGKYENITGGYDEEYSVYLDGDWTPAERAEVFRGVHRRVFPGAYRSMPGEL